MTLGVSGRQLSVAAFENDVPLPMGRAELQNIDSSGSLFGTCLNAGLMEA